MNDPNYLRIEHSTLTGVHVSYVQPADGSDWPPLAEFQQQLHKYCEENGMRSTPVAHGVLIMKQDPDTNEWLLHAKVTLVPHRPAAGI